MKKISTSVSPFIMLIVPVILILGLSLGLKQQQQTEEAFTAAHKSKATLLVEASVSSLVSVMLKK
ncbi:hypothetical protein [Pedobacter puniceum]|uniref:Uncharacterized protein n=1 Tax=Pedobacter puniceum TaxID=2666136 RepID=A0A7K0FRA2_9SPHI|nr:hypothetical protein [Pedobacter puniceum]MRX47617.1 hypothetical protein [Pedobacter puniceum]